MNPKDAAPADPTRPEKLYRFRPPRKRELDAIFGRGQLWFARPSKLGDPYECTPELVPPTAEEMERHLLEHEVGPLAPGDKKAWASLRRKVKRRLTSETFLTKAWREVVDGYGLLALTTELHSPLLWAQRADRHRGFCLEFDCRDPRSMPIGPAKRVHYAEARPQVEPLGLRTQPKDELERLCFRYKSPHWSFEREWRLIAEGGEGHHAFPRRLLSAVYLGGACTPRNRNLILKKLATWAEHDRPPVYRMRVRAGDFELDRVEIADELPQKG